MPTYDYACEKCGHHFEQFQSMLDATLTTCPKKACPRKKWGKGKVRRAIGAGAGLIFKGSGFYITDYRSESYKAAARKDSTASTPASSDASKSGSTTATESKNGGKKESKDKASSTKAA